MTIPFIILLCAITIIIVILLVIIIVYLYRLNKTYKKNLQIHEQSKIDLANRKREEIDDLREYNEDELELYSSCNYYDLDNNQYEIDYLKTDGKPEICKRKTCDGYENGKAVKKTYYGLTKPTACRQRSCIGVKDNTFYTFNYIGDNKPAECDFRGCHTLDNKWNLKSYLYPMNQDKPDVCDIKRCKVYDDEYGNWTSTGKTSMYLDDDNKPPECVTGTCKGPLNIWWNYRKTIPYHPGCNNPTPLCWIMLDSYPNRVLTAAYDNNPENGSEIRLFGTRGSNKPKNLWRLHSNGAIELGSTGYYIHMSGNTDIFEERRLHLWDSTNKANARWENKTRIADDASIVELSPKYESKNWVISQWSPYWDNWVCMRNKNNGNPNCRFRIAFFTDKGMTANIY